MHPAHPVIVGVGPVSPDEVIAVARRGARVELSDEALAKIEEGRSVIDALARDSRPHYGVSTGFGALATKHIPAERRVQLQRGVVRSHAAGSGAAVEREVVRAMMLLRLSTMATGRTGIRTITAAAYAATLSAGITPIVPEYGSLGCSGDLAPLAHCALTVTGEGQVRDAAGELRDAADALREAGISPVALQEKEGLALINGTDGMLGMLVLAIADLRMLLTTADITAAMSVEGQLGTDAAFDDDLQRLRPQAGQAAAAANMRAVLADSAIVASHRGPEDTTVQDAYSLRCAPPSPGPRATPSSTPRWSRPGSSPPAIDNPVITLDGRVRVQRQLPRRPGWLRAGFPRHRRCRCRGLSERRTDRFLDIARNHGLNAFLADDPGVDSGYMIAQYTQAAIVSDLKRLAVPASVDSIPSSAMQEDHVSMGWSAGRKLRKAVDGLTRVLAIELLTAARGIEQRSAAPPAPATAAVIAALRESTPGPGADRFLAPEIEAAVQLVASGGARSAAESVTGPLA